MTTKTSWVCGAAAGALLALTLGGAAQAQETKIEWKGAPEFTFGEFTFKPRGRVFLDYVNQDVDRDSGADFEASNTRIRTARIGVEGSYGEQWSYVAEANIVGGEAEWEDLTLEYKPTKNTALTLGNFKTVSLENLTSSRFTTFMERGAINDVMGMGRTMNLQAKANGANWTAAVFASGDNINGGDVVDRGTGAREQFGVGGRVTFAPIVTDATKVHLGAWARHRNREDQANYAYGARNNTNYGSRYTTTGAIGVRDTQVGLEAAVVHNSFSVQGEWATADVQRIADVESDVRAWYVFGSWFPTGETRRYEPNRGRFNRVKVLEPVTSGGMGALELAVRYDNADLTDVAGVPTAGEYSAWTVGANWYPMGYVRFMANYSVSENDLPGPAADVDVKTFQLRAQFDF